MKTTITKNHSSRSITDVMRKCFSVILFLMLFLCSHDSWAQIALRGTATTSVSTNASVTVNRPTGVVAGDIMFANVANFINATQTSASCTGWTVIAGTDMSRGRATLLYKIAGASEPASYTFTVTTGSSAATGAIVAFSGVNTASPFDVTAPTSWTTNATQTISSITGLTTANANAAIVLFGSCTRMTSTSNSNFTGWTATNPSAFTELFDRGHNNVADTPAVGAAWATRTTTGATGNGGVTCTPNTSPRTMAGLMLALRPCSTSAGTLSGTQTICSNGTSTFSSSASGGIWSSDNTGVATINSTTGAISGVSAGTATMTYTLTTCGNTYTATRTVTVTAAPTAGTLTGVQTTCIGGTTSFSSSQSGGAWTSSNTAIATINNTTGVITGVAAGTATMTYTVTGTGGCSNAQATRTVTITTLTAPTFTAIAPVCSGATIAALPTTSTNGITGTWSPALNNTATTTYTFTPTAGQCAASTTLTITVNPSPTGVTAIASNNTICLGETLNLTAAATSNSSTAVTVLSQNFNSATNNWTRTNASTGGTTANAAWTLRASGYNDGNETFTTPDASQFYLSNSDAQGTGGITNTTLVSPAMSTSGMSAATINVSHYYRFNSGTDDRAFVEASTNGTTWTTLTTYSSTQGAANAFATANINLTASFLNQSTVYIRFRYTGSFDWYWAINNVIVSGTLTTAPDATYAWTSNPAGFTSALKNPTGLTPSVTTTYTVTATNSFGCTASESVTVVVNNLTNASVSIAASESTICSGTSVTFTATPTNGGSTPSYQWRINGSNVGTDSATFTSTTLANNDVVTVVMTSNATPCLTGSPATSNGITMTVNPLLNASVSIAATASTICSGTSVTFTATPTDGGTAPSYQWRVNGSNAGTNSATFTSSTLATNDVVTVEMTSNATPCLIVSSALSNEITMTVNTQLTASVSITASETTICSGTSVTFTATPTNGGTAPSYQWRINGSNVGTDSATFTSSTLANNDVVTLVMTSNATPCILGSPATSNGITMNVNALTAFTSVTPVNNDILANETTNIQFVGLTGTNANASWFTEPNGGGAFLGTGAVLANVGPGKYYVQITGDCGASSEVAVEVFGISSWTGAINTLWNVPGNWAEGVVPNAYCKVTIGAGKVAEVLASDATAYNVAVSGNGVLTVKSGRNITVTNQITTAAATNIVVESNANLVQTNAVANTTPITVKRNSSALKRLDYILWSTPVVGQNLLAFSPLTTVTPSSRFYTYNTTTNLYNAITAPSTVSMEQAKGYLIRVPNNHPTWSTIWNGQYVGVPNNGNIAFALTNSIDSTKRYNLVGNPYPSAISLNKFIDANQDNIKGTLYFWRKTNGAPNNSYWAISKFGYSSNGEGSNPNGIIQVGQGFIVEAKENATQVVFNNDMRVLNNANQMFKASENAMQTANYDRYWVKMTSATGSYSQIMVGYFDGATQGFDIDYDAKQIADGDILLSSIVDGGNYAIQGKNAFEVNDVVPLSYTVTNAGTYTITLDAFEGVFDGATEVYLTDAETGSSVLLNNGAYTFTTAAGSFANRFQLNYQTVLNQGEITANDEVSVKFVKGQLRVDAGTTPIKDIYVYDITGKKVASALEVNSPQFEMNNLPKNRILIVKIIANDQRKIVKKVQ
jgi:hypothetical protein